jgi:hypothetical protein
VERHLQFFWRSLRREEPREVEQVQLDVGVDRKLAMAESAVCLGEHRKAVSQQRFRQWRPLILPADEYEAV